MAIDILIPTCKDEWEILSQIGEMIEVDRWCSDLIYYSCLKKSAAINRNNCLNNTNSEYVVMVDDDITGFFSGWYELMVDPLKKDTGILYVSARLMNEIGGPQMVMGFSKELKRPLLEVQVAPSACIAFRRDDTRFLEEYEGSGWEDLDFHMQLKKKYGDDKKVFINNKVKLIHKHEMKNQNGLGPGFNPFDHNRDIFDRRWPGARRMFAL